MEIETEILVDNVMFYGLTKYTFLGISIINREEGSFVLVYIEKGKMKIGSFEVGVIHDRIKRYKFREKIEIYEDIS